MLARRVYNAEEVIGTLSDHPGLADVSLQVGHFEFLALHEQMELVVNSELLFGVHGAGMLQGLFLSPCSMLIEMFAIGGGQPAPGVYAWTVSKGRYASYTCTRCPSGSSNRSCHANDGRSNTRDLYMDPSHFARFVIGMVEKWRGCVSKA